MGRFCMYYGPSELPCAAANRAGDTGHGTRHSLAMRRDVMRQRSRVLYIAASLAILAASLSLTARGVAASRPASSSTGAWIPAPAEPGTAIPTASVAFGMRPYADNTFYVVAMKKGWFKDVGIQITPAP